MIKSKLKFFICSLILISLSVNLMTGCKNGGTPQDDNRTEKAGVVEEQSSFVLKYDYKINQVDTRLMFDNVLEEDEISSVANIIIRPTIKSEYEKYFSGWNKTFYYNENNAVSKVIVSPSFDENQIGFYLCENESMFPTMSVLNGYIYLNQSEYNINDVVVWNDKENGVNFAHRVVRINDDKTGCIKYFTKGDNNLDEDVDYLTGEIICGKIIKCIDDFSKDKSDIEKSTIKSAIYVNSTMSTSMQVYTLPGATYKCELVVRQGGCGLLRTKLSCSVGSSILNTEDKIDATIADAENYLEKTQFVKFGDYLYLMKDYFANDENDKMYNLNSTQGDIKVIFYLHIPDTLSNSLISQYKLCIEVNFECIQSEIFDSCGELIDPSPQMTKELFNQLKNDLT